MICLKTWLWEFRNPLSSREGVDQMRDGTDLDKFARSGKIAFLTELSQICPDQWTLTRYSKMDREGWFPKFVIMRNIIKSDMRKVTILLWSLSQDFSKIREMTTISCLCQIYIQTILKFINNYACCPFKFYFSSKVQETTPSPRFMVYIHSRQKVQAKKSKTLT